MASTKTILTCILSIGVAMCAPAADAFAYYDEVIPGPGMPSLESLGLTSRALYEMSPDADVLKRAALYQATCFDNGIPTCSAANAQACVNYLKNKGHTNCQVGGSGVSKFCTAGQCNIYGNGAGQSSYCSDVGAGAQTIVNNCNRNGQVEGTNAAGGNGALIVNIRHG